MPLSKESVERHFAEQVGRPIDPVMAEAVAGLIAALVDALNQVDQELIFLVEPSTAFQATYALQRREGYGRVT